MIHIRKAIVFCVIVQNLCTGNGSEGKDGLEE